MDRNWIIIFATRLLLFVPNYSACHTCTVWSPPPETMRLPSGDHATAISGSEWPL